MKIKKILLCLLTVLTLTGCQSGEVPQETKKTESAAPTEQTEPEEPTEEFILGDNCKWFLGQPSYQQLMADIKAQDYKPLEPGNEYYTSITIDGDELRLEVTEKQKENIIANNVKLAQGAVEVFSQLSDKNTAEWNDDFSNLTFYMDCEKSYGDNVVQSGMNMESVVMLNYVMSINRVLVTGDRDEVINTTVINAESGHILANALMPFEPVSITSKDYEVSKTQDVVETSKYDEYEEVKMEVKSIDENRIIFTPLERDKFYTNDESLCLCLDSVYAEEVAIPTSLKAGDVMVLRVNGMYALHDDGDDIPDIAPLTMVPLKYWEAAHQS